MSIKITDHSTGIVAERDVNLTVNNGLQMAEVRELTSLYLEQNFPKLREDAIIAATENVKLLMNEFQQQFDSKGAQIDINNFKNPEVQYALNEATIAAAKRGEDANVEILVDLIMNKISINKNDKIDLLSSDAISIASKLSKAQIALLSLKWIFSDLVIIPKNNSYTIIQFYESICKSLLELMPEINTCNKEDTAYLSSYCLSIVDVPYYGSAIALLSDKYKEQYSEESFLIAYNSTSFLKVCGEIYNKTQLYRATFNSIGKLLARINLRKCLGSLDHIPILSF